MFPQQQHKVPILRILFTASVLFVFFSTSSWRAEHGLSFSVKCVEGPEAELIELNKALVPTIERRGILRSQLENSENKASEIEKEIASKIVKFDESKRSELREQFEANALSEDNMQSPEIAQIYARYVEATELQRHTSTLREQLAAYEYQLTLALAQRDRLQERVDSIKQLGFDPQNDVTLDKEKNFEMFEKLASLGNTKYSELTVEDVVSANNEAKQVVDRVFPKEDATHENEPIYKNILGRLLDVVNHNDGMKQIIDRVFSPKKSAEKEHKSNLISKDTLDTSLDADTDDTDNVVETLSDALTDTSDDLNKQIDNLKIERSFGPFDRTVEFITNDDGSVTKIESGIIGDRELNSVTNIFNEMRREAWRNCFTIVITVLIVMFFASTSPTFCRVFRVLSSVVLYTLFILLIVSAGKFLGVFS